MVSRMKRVYILPGSVNVNRQGSSDIGYMYILYLAFAGQVCISTIFSLAGPYTKWTKIELFCNLSQQNILPPRFASWLNSTK